MSPALRLPAIFIYDGYPGGVGYARAARRMFTDWLTAARDLLRAARAGAMRGVCCRQMRHGNQCSTKGRRVALAEAILKKNAPKRWYTKGVVLSGNPKLSHL
jgi:DEAD/DEAH box helicase domain-containing protein